MKINRRVAFGLGLVLILLISGYAALDRLPALWWDEGWTMSAARNWIERGHYGQLLNGQPAPPGMSAAFPSIASIALSFKVLGIGAWQARWPFVIYTFTALGALYWLGRRLYDRGVAVTAVLLLLLTSTDPFVNPIFVGRQVLAEMVMLTCLLAGYACLWLTLERPTRTGWFQLSAIGLFAIGLSAKGQPLPFWVVSLILPLVVTLAARQWRQASVLTIILLGSYVAMRVFVGLQATILYPGTPAVPAKGVYDLVAAVLLPGIRVTVLALTVQMALPTVLGLLAVGRALIEQWRPDHRLDARALLRLSLFGLSGSWLAWYVLLSRGLPRYAFPALFVGSLFTAALVMTIGQRWRVRLARPQRRTLRAGDIGGLVVAGVLCAMLILNLNWVIGLIQGNVYPGVAAFDAAEYVNQHAAPGAVVETYESEVMFYLRRPYHYPPDEIAVELVQREMIDYEQAQSLLSRGELLRYDPLTANPDYLIVGPADSLWYEPYAGVLASGAFRPVFAAGRYQVFERAR